MAQFKSNRKTDEEIDTFMSTKICQRFRSYWNEVNANSFQYAFLLMMFGVLVSSSCSLQGSIRSTDASSQTTASSDPNLLSSNIKYGVSIFGIVGSYIGSFQKTMASNALRDAGVPVISNLSTQPTSLQLSLDAEQNLYNNGADLPTTSGFNYRDVPDETKDDEGYDGTTCKYATRPLNNCGTTQTTIADRMADCAIQNPTTSTWDGSTQCNRGNSQWKLVTRSAVNKEVWQDQRTGQVWSTQVSTATNWCQAAGNIKNSPMVYINSYNTSAGTLIIGNGTIGSLSGGSSTGETITITFTNATNFSVTGTAGLGGCQSGAISSGGLSASAGSTVTFGRANYCSFTLTQGSTNFAANDKFIIRSAVASIYSCAPAAASGLQPASPVSYCAEVAGLNPPSGETWSTGSYMTAKGGMGRINTAGPSVRWRLPTLDDYLQANLDGIRMVMPDMGIAGASRLLTDGSIGGSTEWTATMSSQSRSNAWGYSSTDGDIGTYARTGSFAVRCVGR